MIKTMTGAVAALALTAGAAFAEGGCAWKNVSAQAPQQTTIVTADVPPQVPPMTLQR